MNAAVIWHDVECGAYAADLTLWRELAGAAPPGVLDVGAGTGRVTLRLALAGHRVTALDRDAVLLATLAGRARAAGVRVETVLADAAGFDVGEHRFGLVAVPMQTLQLLPGADARAGFYASAARAAVRGGTVAVAIASELEDFDGTAALPLPDLGEHEGRRYISQPLAVRTVDDRVCIERVRQVVEPDGARTYEPDVVVLARVSPALVADEAAAHGLAAVELRRVPETDDHVGSEVVVLRA